MPHPWAKYDKATGNVHLLIHHSADVAACAEALLTRTLLRRRLARLGGQDDLTDGQIARFCVLAALHDMGKANRGFQNRIRRSGDQGYRGLVASHQKEVIAFLCGPRICRCCPDRRASCRGLPRERGDLPLGRCFHLRYRRSPPRRRGSARR
ncbi:MAG: HD domain-containing protein [Acidobacteriota bacterium]